VVEVDGAIDGRVGHLKQVVDADQDVDPLKVGYKKVKSVILFW